MLRSHLKSGHREQDSWPTVKDGHCPLQSKHPNVMHGPNAGSHGDGSGGEPNELSASPGRRHAAGQIQRGVRSENRQQYRKGDEAVIVNARECDC